MFERRLDQLTDAVETSQIFAKTMIMALLIATSNFPVLCNFAKQSAVLAWFLTFSLAEKCRPIPRKIVVFPLEPSTELMQRTFVSFMPALALKLESVERHVLGNCVILVSSTITSITAWHLIPAVQERSVCQHASLFFTTLVQT